MFDGLRHHVFDLNLTDLQNNKVTFRKRKLIAEAVQGKTVYFSQQGFYP